MGMGIGIGVGVGIGIGVRDVQMCIGFRYQVYVLGIGYWVLGPDRASGKEESAKGNVCL